MSKLPIGIPVLLSLLFAITAHSEEITDFIFNDLTIRLDDSTGNLLYLSHPDTGVIIDVPAVRSGMIDLALPSEESPFRRLASRYSKTRISKIDKDVIAITWDKLLPANKDDVLEGKVRATVVIRKAPDGRSVIFRCNVKNDSSLPIPQVMFPDIWGLNARHCLRDVRRGINVVSLCDPDINKNKSKNNIPPYMERDDYWGKTDALPLAWLNIGSYESGISIFQRTWRQGKVFRIIPYVHLSKDPVPTFRLCMTHRLTIEPGQEWDSGEFWLTPHKGGWAKGIEPFREYVSEVNPRRELPAHIRDGIGYRTIWMMERTETDPDMADFRFEDIPRVAKECADHGLNEMVIWFWNHRPNWMPLKVRPELGTKEEFLEGIRQAKEMGVNVSLFYTVCIIRPSIAKERYGLDVKPTSNWTYHTDCVPMFRPYYLSDIPSLNQHELVSLGAGIPFANKYWQEDVFKTFKEWIDGGVESITWDVFRSHEYSDGEKPDIIELVQTVREYAREKNPNSTFSGELISMTDRSSTQTPEWDNLVLDYTWDWVGYRETEPYLNVLNAPRLNMIVNRSPKMAKKGFCAGLFLNVMPRTPDRPNATAMIADEPALSKTLKELVKLRKQFLPYFVDGTSIGDSVLKKAAPAFIRAYQKEDRLLMIALNETDETISLNFETDLSLWLPEAPKYLVNYYNNSGTLYRIETRRTAGDWKVESADLEPLDLAFVEIIADHSDKERIRYASINDWTIGLDPESGSLLKLAHPEVGTIIDTVPSSAGIIDLAYPVWDYLPCRLGTRYSEATISQSPDELTITWNRLGPNRTHFIMPEGDVSAEVTISAADDGKSLEFGCSVSNDTDTDVVQVLFPDFIGLNPIQGREETFIKFGEQTVYPFRGTLNDPEQPRFYGVINGWKSYKPASSENGGLDWLVLSGDQSDLRISQRQAGETEQFAMTQRKQISDLYLRLCIENRATISKNRVWESPKIILTPIPKTILVQDANPEPGEEKEHGLPVGDNAE